VTTVKMLPCPFCGSVDVKLYKSTYCVTDKWAAWVECKACSSEGPEIAETYTATDDDEVRVIKARIQSAAVVAWNAALRAEPTP